MFSTGGAAAISAPSSQFHWPPRAAAGDFNVSKSNNNNNVEEDRDELTSVEQSYLRKVLRKGLVEDLESQRRDPNSPLYSVRSFKGLNLKEPLLRGIYEGMRFDAPSKIQEMALPDLLANPPVNMIAQAQSGTGKTAAFVLAMLSRVDTTLPFPQILCLSPTYELAVQTGEVAHKMSQFMPDIAIRYAVRGEEIPRGSKITDHIIIGTPGKLLDWALKFRFFDIRKIRVFVLDEADVMIDVQGHSDQSIRIQRQLDPRCQILLFSATYEKRVMDFAESLVANPVTIRLRREEESLDNIRQFWVDCPTPESKYRAIANIYGSITIGQAMIFCRTRNTAHWLQQKLCKDGHSVAVLSGELTVEQRITTLDRYRSGQCEKVLISTNVMARGIDVAQVTLVVNYDLPIDQEGRADCETYLHRIGRTGRFGRCGYAINLVDGEGSLEVLKQIQAHFGKEIKSLNTDDVDAMESLDRK